MDEFSQIWITDERLVDVGADQLDLFHVRPTQLLKDGVSKLSYIIKKVALFDRLSITIKKHKTG